MPMSNTRILPTAAELTIRHDQLIGQYNIVSSCLTEHDLTGLSSFDNLSEDKIVPEVMSNLEVSQNKEEQVLYDLVYYSTEPADAQTILNSLIVTYEKNLTQQYQNDSDEVENLLKKVHQDFTEGYQELQKELDRIFETHQAPVVTDTGLTEHEVQVVTLGKCSRKHATNWVFSTKTINVQSQLWKVVPKRSKNTSGISKKMAKSRMMERVKPHAN